VRVKIVDAQPLVMNDARDFVFDDEAAGGGVLEIKDEDGYIIAAVAPGRWDYVTLLVRPKVEEAPDAR
jgi:Na+-transporting NADH:ubiquinone oxidoreductase subunit NqrA